MKIVGEGAFRFAAGLLALTRILRGRRNSPLATLVVGRVGRGVSGESGDEQYWSLQRGEEPS